MTDFNVELKKITNLCDALKTSCPYFPFLSPEEMLSEIEKNLDNNLLNEAKKELEGESDRVNIYPFLSQLCIELSENSEEAADERRYLLEATAIAYTRYVDEFKEEPFPQVLTYFATNTHPAWETVAFIIFAFKNTVMTPEDILRSGLLQQGFKSEGDVPGLDVFPQLFALTLDEETAEKIKVLHDMAGEYHCGDMCVVDPVALNGQERSTSELRYGQFFPRSVKANSFVDAIEVTGLSIS